ncbi:MAG TPA: DUF5916 domain-containing protein [Gemmatimonadaceae bacterium]
MRGRWSVFPLLLLCLTTGRSLSAQEKPPLELPRLSAPVVVDGNLNDPAWDAIAALPLTMYAPVFKGTPSQRSIIKVAYDDEYFYAAGWFYDENPEGIRINSLYRDRWNGDDAFAIYIDAFNDNQNSKWFGTTPGGIRFDLLVSDDGATLNDSWDTFWTARSTVAANGWFSEVRIPFSSIGFKVGEDGRATMGLTVTRLVSRTGERVTFPEIDPRFEFRRPSVAHDVVMREVQTRKPLYVTPYALTSRTQAVLAEPPGFRTERGTTSDIGLDVRYPLSSRLTLDLTVNTDFAQVEADDQQVNLDRFPLFYPERRRFFQEQSGLFDFVGGGGTRLFHSRRIGLAPDFTPVPILAGARLVGRAGAWDVGALEMQTDDQPGSPAEHFGVLRLRRPVFNRYSTAGVMVTSLRGGENNNLALGADGSFRVRGDDYLTLKWMSSFDGADSAGTPITDRSQYYLRWERRTGRGLQYQFNATRSGPDFRPSLGFLPRRDFTSANIVGNYYIFTDRNSYFRRVYPGALAFQTFRNSDGALESAQWAFWVQWDTKAGGGGWVEPKWFHENVAQSFRIGGVIDIPRGEYDFADLQVVWSMPAGARLRADIDARAGTYFDGHRMQIIAAPTWNVSPFLELGGDYQVTKLRFPVRNQAATLQVARLRVRAARDARASASAIAQYNSTTERLDLNLRLRYAFAEGTDLWLVYNEGLDIERVTDPALSPPPLSRSRAFILKYTRTLAF